MKAKSIKRITIKIGSNVLTNPDGLPNNQIIQQITTQVHELKKKGIQVILVSSGAVAAGRSIFKTSKKLDTVAERQLLSSLGQVRLIQTYTEMFNQYNLLCAQVLVTKQDFRERHHYRNMQNCLEALLNNDIVPVINENDVISVTELMFTDNDELAGLVSAMMNVDTLYILTNVNGIYNGNPDDSGSHLIEVYDKKIFQPQHIASTSKSQFGRGGIITKTHTALKIAGMGIPVIIANGNHEDIILKILNDEKHGTYFPPQKTASALKKWIAHSKENAKGEVVINKGAKESLLSEMAVSLLPVGIIKVSGDFKRGDIIKVLDDNGQEIGLGIARYNLKKAESVTGLKNQKPLIHYDHLYLH